MQCWGQHTGWQKEKCRKIRIWGLWGHSRIAAWCFDKRKKTVRFWRRSQPLNFTHWHIFPKIWYSLKHKRMQENIFIVSASWKVAGFQESRNLSCGWINDNIFYCGLQENFFFSLSNLRKRSASKQVDYSYWRSGDLQCSATPPGKFDPSPATCGPENWKFDTPTWTPLNTVLTP